MIELRAIAEKIREADLVLVGLGEELDKLKELVVSGRYEELAGKTPFPWAVPFVRKVLLEETRKEEAEWYQLLADCLRQKNYFVVSLSRDGSIGGSALEAGRMVEPCGGYERLQCCEGCSRELYQVPRELLAQIREFVGGAEGEQNWNEPLCPHCGKALVFNNTDDARNYVEEGYLERWQVYRKWLQGTVNKRVCILELGVGMKYPTVIRWPFEKMVFFNQKAELFRVHDRLYQIPEEIRERGYGICQKPEDFIKELSEFFR